MSRATSGYTGEMLPMMSGDMSRSKISVRSEGCRVECYYEPKISVLAAVKANSGNFAVGKER